MVKGLCKKRRHSSLPVSILAASSDNRDPLPPNSENQRRTRQAPDYLSGPLQKGRKGAGIKGAGVANCRVFRSAVPSVVVWSILLVSVSGVKKKKKL